MTGQLLNWQHDLKGKPHTKTEQLRCIIILNSQYNTIPHQSAFLQEPFNLSRLNAWQQLP